MADSEEFNDCTEWHTLLGEMPTDDSGSIMSQDWTMGVEVNEQDFAQLDQWLVPNCISDSGEESKKAPHILSPSLTSHVTDRKSANEPLRKAGMPLSHGRSVDADPESLMRTLEHQWVPPSPFDRGPTNR